MKKYDKPLLYEGESNRGSKIKSIFGISQRQQSNKDSNFIEWFNSVDQSSDVLLSEFKSIADSLTPTLKCCEKSATTTCCGNFEVVWKSMDDDIMRSYQAISGYDSNLLELMLDINQWFGEQMEAYSIGHVIVIVGCVVWFINQWKIRGYKNTSLLAMSLIVNIMFDCDSFKQLYIDVDPSIYSALEIKEILTVIDRLHRALK